MTDQIENKNRQSDDVMISIFDRATVRSRPAKTAEKKAFDSLHARWQQNQRARRRRRILAPLGLAASLLVAVAVVWLRSAGDSPAPAVMAASIARMSGDYATVRNPSVGEQSVANSNGVMTGSVVTTGPATRLALAWLTGGSLRLDANTRIAVVSPTRVELLAGVLYYDSQNRLPPEPTSAVLTIQTPRGSVRHVGTQFIVRVDSNDASVTVREGKVRFEGTDLDLEVASGQQIHVNASGLQSRREFDSHGDAWLWVEQIAPHFQADGRSAADVLDWIAREKGHRLIYHRQARRIAQQTVIHGMSSVAPDSALDALGIATDLRFDIAEGNIEVQERAR